MDPALPPGPRGPALPQWLGWGFAPVPFLLGLRRRYGDVFTIRVFGETLVILADPAHVKEVFTGSPDDLYSGQANLALRSLIGTRNVLLLDGDEHLHRRRLVLPPFHGDRMRTYEAVVRQAARAELATWPIGEPLAALPRMRDITFEVILRAVFGADEAGRLEGLRATLAEILAFLIEPPRALVLGFMGPDRLMALRSFQRRVAAVDAELLAHVAERRRDPGLAEREDIMSMLLQARTEDGEPLGDQDIRDELVTLLIAGHETTAALLAWAIHDVVRTPGALDRLAAREPGYAEAVVREALRLHPPVPIVVRRLQRPLTIAGRDLPAGATVAPCAILVHRREDLYPGAATFRPERFLDAKPSTYGWIPFGGGVRRCLGAPFAQMEAQVVLEELASTYLLRPARGRRERLGRRGIVLVPGRGARIVVTGRRPAVAAVAAPEAAAVA